jgi:2-C-methyl-D-erythritol 2,4-cyclodiphosphate synthase
MGFRIGNGFDAHKFRQGVPLVLGGVTIPYEYGLEAHSDGDVLIHALCDALLGAMAAGDIGQHFPDTDQGYQGIDSRKLLRSVASLMAEKGYRIENADLTIIAQAPKMAPHVQQMQENLAADVGVDIDQISIKATTTEGMGFTGRKEGIAALASVLVHS